MVYDFLKTCKTYEKKKYTKKYFINTPCPKCPAIGRYNLHGSYHRWAFYFDNDKLIIKYMDIKRILCISCKSTHAVMPGDIIPYTTLTLFVFIYILASIYLKKISVLQIARVRNFSFQFIYYVIGVFCLHINNIRQYIREVYPGTTPPTINEFYIINFIKKQLMEFQYDYIKLNRRPCFMCKFFGSAGAPPVGIYAP